MSPRVAGIVLAAGEGRRFGAIKQLATFHGEPLVRRAVRHAREAGADPVIVVVGAHESPVTDALHGLDVRVVRNADWTTGIASSLRAGIALITDDDDVAAALIVTIDQPLVDAVMLRSLVGAFHAGHGIVAAEYDGVIGIPVVIARALLPDLSSAVTGDRGAGAWLRAQREHVTEMAAPMASHDADSLAELRALEHATLTVETSVKPDATTK